MSEPINPVSDYELHAYVDGELDAQRRSEVEAWLAINPEARSRIADYHLIEDELHAHFDPVLYEASYIETRPHKNVTASLARAAVMAGAMLVSGFTGWSLHHLTDDVVASPALQDLVRPAAFAHLVYAADQRYPVEIPAFQQASLNNWVKQRMHTDINAPDLSTEGLTLIGGRLLPSTNRMAVQFMYEDNNHERITVYVRKVDDKNIATEFRYVAEDQLQVFYWINAKMGYAVIGDQPASRLIAVANAVQASFRI
jgi:anti-sigma factor RsiW